MIYPNKFEAARGVIIVRRLVARAIRVGGHYERAAIAKDYPKMGAYEVELGYIANRAREHEIDITYAVTRGRNVIRRNRKIEEVNP